MAKCEVCGKGQQHGHNVSFSKRRTNRVWRPNITQTTLYEGGRARRAKVCANCLKTLRKSA
jgi:large subunit ribosomal protein L28